jgi:hypothetical protein
MKRALLPVAPLMFLLLFSCLQKSENPVPESVVADARSAFVIMADLPLWTLAQGVLTFKESIPIGEKLTLLGQTTKVTQSGKERDLQQVRRMSGSEGWVRADYIVSRAILAVVTTDDAMIYTVPHNTAATTSSIPRMTVLAIHADTGGMTFIKVTAFDPAAKLLLKGVYLRNEGVSSKPSDVQAAILLQLAAASKNQKQQQAFLRSAIKDHPDSIFMPELTTALAALVSPPASQPAQQAQPSPAAKPRSTVAASGSMAVTADGVKVYDSPDEKAGKLLATLLKGQKVDIIEKTADDPAADPGSSWYRIKDPAGWVNATALTTAN